MHYLGVSKERKLKVKGREAVSKTAYSGTPQPRASNIIFESSNHSKKVTTASRQITPSPLTVLK